MTSGLMVTEGLKYIITKEDIFVLIARITHLASNLNHWIKSHPTPLTMWTPGKPNAVKPGILGLHVPHS